LLGGPPVGVYMEYESDATGRYTCLAGVRIPSATAAPPGLRVVTIPAGEYLVFRSEGPVPESVFRGWQAIWKYFDDNPAEHRAFYVDVELYGEECVDLLIS
jgi:predicted transcriptional regulator YdeE